MSRLKKIGWSMVPGWVTYVCSTTLDEKGTPVLTAEHASVAGCILSYSFWKKEPITPNYQQVASSLWGASYSFSGESVGYIDRLISDLIKYCLLFRTTDGKIMPGIAARYYERDSAPKEFWEPLNTAKAVDNLINELSGGETP